MDCTICVAKPKALISCAFTAQLIYVFVFAYAKSRFSHNETHMVHVISCFIFFYAINWHRGFRKQVNIISIILQTNRMYCLVNFKVHLKKLTCPTHLLCFACILNKIIPLDVIKFLLGYVCKFLQA